MTRPSVVRELLAGVRRVALAAVLAAAVLSIGPAAAGQWQAGGSFVVHAASPTASPDAGDTRSAGQGPGIVGSPFVAITGVLGIGLGAAAITLLYVRLSGPQSSARPGSGRPGDGQPTRRLDTPGGG